jgi:hypothetical protein
VQEKGVGVTYKNLRLVSTRFEWEWVGEVHEYVHRKDGWLHTQQDIDGLWFDHDASGGQEGKRFVRDEVILAKVRATLGCYNMRSPVILRTSRQSCQMVSAQHGLAVEAAFSAAVQDMVPAHPGRSCAQGMHSSLSCRWCEPVLTVSWMLLVVLQAVSQRPADPRARFYYANTLRYAESGTQNVH